ncbi:MAG: DUF1365 family protein [Pseudomonadota bacterium]
MNSLLYEGIVEHTRFHPVDHQLNYGIYVYAIDLDDLPLLDRRLPLFGYNRWRPVSIRDADYLARGRAPLRRKLDRLLAPHVAPDTVQRAILVTAPRYMGYIFNPVSFYFCFDAEGAPLVMVAEVNNTFGERHAYVLPVENSEGQTFPIKFTTEKKFHVSPFNTVDGVYRFVFNDIRETLDIGIKLERDGRPILEARLKGEKRPLTAWQQLKTIVAHPVLPYLTVPRIYKEAFKLHFEKKLFYYDKPVPGDAMTLRRNPPTFIQKRSMAMVMDFLARSDRGALELQLPDGTLRLFGEPGAVAPADLRINDYRFFSRVVLGGDIGFGESFMNGDWDSNDVVGVVRFFIQNRDHVQDGRFSTAVASRLLETIRHRIQRNTLLGSRKNIRRHYDLSNDFFKLFLDPTMAYSAAVFNRPEDDLETAQRAKFDRIIDKARITEDDHVLEIGCGWGGFAMAAVRKTGCRVTGITVSKEQYVLAREGVRAAGLEHRIDIQLTDYRRVAGRYDKIVSVEMLEAVGHEYYGRYFERLEALLKPEGVAVIQTITIPDQRYERYRKESDWIRKHIFPGGLLPSLTVLASAMTRHSQLMVEHVENIGDHYAETLKHWRRRFLARLDRVAAMGFDRVFQRKWLYYLASCEAGFRERVLGDVQLVLTREGNSALSQFDEDPAGAAAKPGVQSQNGVETPLQRGHQKAGV